MCTKVLKKSVTQNNIESFLYDERNKHALSFLTCGSVDDGKSTLVGRLLYDTKQIYSDQLSKLYNNDINHKHKTIDFSLLVDSLQSEREQGITIDVSYRYFSTRKCKFIIVDTPGHEQYTRNMATGASNCDIAVLLIDARKGVVRQTKRHSFINVLLGIRYFIIAINKMDLVNYEKKIFDSIKQVYLNFINTLSVNLTIKFIPLSALYGDNISKLTNNMLWYNDLTLLETLENAEVSNFKTTQATRFPVQYVNRVSKLDFRGYSGNLISGKLFVGQKIKILPSGIISTISRIVTFDGDLIEAWPGEALTLVLSDDIDISRGDLLVDYDQIILISNYAQIYVIWMYEQPLTVDNIFNIKIAHKTITGRISNIKYQIDINTLSKIKVDNLQLNSIGLIELILDEAIVLDKYIDHKITGSMIFIDKLNNNTVGAGMVYKPLLSKSYKNDKYNKFEYELNALIRHYFPHWHARNISK